MGWVWRLFEKPSERVKAKASMSSGNPNAVRNLQYEPPRDGDGWLGNPPPGSPEHRAWLRWLFE